MRNSHSELLNISLASLLFADDLLVLKSFIEVCSKTDKTKGMPFILLLNKMSLETNNLRSGKIWKIVFRFEMMWPKQMENTCIHAVWSEIPSKYCRSVVFQHSHCLLVKRKEERNCSNYPANTRHVSKYYSAYSEP